MKTLWLGLVVVLVPSGASAAAWLQCDQSELKNPSCTTLSVNHTPLHFTAACMECSGGGADIKCAPGEKVTPQTLGVETASDNKPVAGSFSQQGTCDFQVPLWMFTGALTKGVTYNVVVTVAGHSKQLLLTFTAGSSVPGVDGSVPPPADGGSTTGDGGGSTSGDGGGSTSGDGATSGTNGSGEEGCSCRLPAASHGHAPVILTGFLLLVLLRRRL